MLSGDGLTDCDLSAALEFHRRKGALMTMVLKRVPVPLEYGVVETDEGGRVRRFVEKPGWGEVFTDTVNTGIYIMEPEALNLIRRGRATLDVSCCLRRCTRATRYTDGSWAATGAT